MDLCLGICALLPEGEPADETGNTAACRARQAGFAGSTGERDVHCPRAGPGGNGTCGTNCESYCMLFEQTCPDNVVSDCETKCSALPDDGTFDADFHHDGDYLQCRLVHTSSSTVDPETHCWHSTITPGPASPCGDLPEVVPTCEDFCTVNETACTNDFMVYESHSQCMDVCAALDPGVAGHTEEDTVACRRYHSYSALEAPDVHCPHTGPGGDGHCGTDSCAAYCRLIAAACGSEFDAEFTGTAQCETECSLIESAAADTGYSVGAANGDTMQCRLLYTSRAFADPSACESALGRGSCQ